MSFTIEVNGTPHTVDVDGDMPLLWVLRDVLGMTGTKFGCGAALCGACTVHVDGMATRSCVTPIDSVGSSAITTIERIGATPEGKPKRFVAPGHVRCQPVDQAAVGQRGAHVQSAGNGDGIDFRVLKPGDGCRFDPHPFGGADCPPSRLTVWRA
jgi:isoquinoline 1-oxidoreductase alpha subunit